MPMLRRGWSIATLLVAIAAVPTFAMSVVLMVTNYFTILATYLQALTPEAIRNRI